MPRLRNPLSHITEKPTQRDLVTWLRSALPVGSKVAAVINETGSARSADPMKRARYFSARIAAGMLPGWPDLICALPAGRVVWIETKRPVGGLLSIDQQRVHADLRAIGHVVGVACDRESALGILQGAGIPLRNVGDMAARPATFRLAKPRKPAPNKFEKFEAIRARTLC